MNLDYNGSLKKKKEEKQKSKKPEKLFSKNSFLLKKKKLTPRRRLSRQNMTSISVGVMVRSNSHKKKIKQGKSWNNTNQLKYQKKGCRDTSWQPNFTLKPLKIKDYFD